MPLLEDLKKLATSVSPSDAPSSTELPTLVGALVKSLEALGVTVGKDLLEASEPELAPVVNTAATDAGHEIDALKSRFEKLEDRLGAFLDRQDAAPAATEPPAPTVSTWPTTPPAEASS